MAEYTIEQVKALTKKRHKHNAKPVRTDDGYFHSTGEYHRWLELLQLEQAGVIAGLTRQVAFPLHCATGDMVTTYSADFVYVDDGGNRRRRFQRPQDGNVSTEAQVDGSGTRDCDSRNGTEETKGEVMSDKEFIRRCLELHKEKTPWVVARYYLWSEGAGSYIEIEERLRRLDPFKMQKEKG